MFRFKTAHWILHIIRELNWKKIILAEKNGYRIHHPWEWWIHIAYRLKNNFIAGRLLWHNVTMAFKDSCLSTHSLTFITRRKIVCRKGARPWSRIGTVGSNKQWIKNFAIFLAMLWNNNYRKEFQNFKWGVTLTRFLAFHKLVFTNLREFVC